VSPFCDTEQSNALHYAASGIRGKINTPVVNFLIEDKDADYKSLVNGKFNLLHLAIQASNIDLVCHIVEKSPDLNSERTCSTTPLAPGGVSEPMPTEARLLRDNFPTFKIGIILGHICPYCPALLPF